MSIPQWILAALIAFILWRSFGQGFISAIQDGNSNTSTTFQTLEKFFIVFVLIGFATLVLNEGIVPTNLNPFKRKFTNSEECFSFIKKNPLSMEKLNIGAASCRVIYDPDQAKAPVSAKNFFQCVLNSYDDIIDDTSGTRVVANCAKSSDESNFSVFFSQQFNPSFRIAQVLEEERRKRQLEKNSLNLFSDLNNTNSNGDGVVHLNKNGTLTPCMKIGLEIDCP